MKRNHLANETNDGKQEKQKQVYYVTSHRICCYVTVILRARIGYEVIDNQRGTWRRAGSQVAQA